MGTAVIPAEWKDTAEHKAITAEDLRDMEQSGLAAKDLLDLIKGLGTTADDSTR